MPLHAPGDQPKLLDLKEDAALLLAVSWDLCCPDGPWHCRRDRKDWVWFWLPPQWCLPDIQQQQKQYSNSWAGTWWHPSLYRLQWFFLGTLALIFLGYSGGLQPCSTSETALLALRMGNRQSGSVSVPDTAAEIMCWPVLSHQACSAEGGLGEPIQQVRVSIKDAGGWMQTQLLHSCSLLVLHPFSLKAAPRERGITPAHNGSCLGGGEPVLNSAQLPNAAKDTRREGCTLCPGKDCLRT